MSATAAAFEAGDVVRPGLTLLRLNIAEHETELEGLSALLGAAELARAQRFVRRDDATRYIVGHGLLRACISQRLGIDPRALPFTQNRHGKPMLDRSPPLPHFNLSHSGQWVLIAIDERAPLGVDVEAVRPNMAQIDDFRGVLAPEEQERLDRLPPKARALAFARNWVRKEAYIKAIGEGMSRDLRSIAIVDGGDGEPQLLYDRNARPAAGSWRLRNQAIDSQHVACLAYRDDV